MADKQLVAQHVWIGHRIPNPVIDPRASQIVSDLVSVYDGWNLIAEVDALLWITHHDDHGVTASRFFCRFPDELYFLSLPLLAILWRAGN